MEKNKIKIKKKKRTQNSKKKDNTQNVSVFKIDDIFQFLNKINPQDGEEQQSESESEYDDKKYDENTFDENENPFLRPIINNNNNQDNQNVSKSEGLIKKSWKTKIGYKCRNSVVRIIVECIDFDWEQPYIRSSNREQNIGSGFFIDENLIITNCHVISNYYKLWINIPSEGEEQYEAEVIGVCFDNDVALLRCIDPPKNTTFLEFGDSNSVVYGQEVLTLGYPLGLESLKLTEGIISGRQNDLLQTDAPLNSGNSGGPMLSSDGKLIGINVSTIRNSQGIGFAIPIYQIQMILENLKNRPKDKLVLFKPILGIEYNSSSESIQEYMGLSKTKKGIYLKKVFPNFPLYNAGVREGDILHKFNGYELDNFGQAQVPWDSYSRVNLESLVNLIVIDSLVEVEYSTNGVIKTSKVCFEDPNNKGYPILPVIRNYHPPFEKIDYEIIGGAVFMELTMDHIEIINERPFCCPQHSNHINTLNLIASSISERMKPIVIISSIMSGSLLSKYGKFKPPIIIHKVNDINISNLKELREAIIQPVEKQRKLFITLTTKDNEFIVLNLQECLKRELELVQNHHYDLGLSVLYFFKNIDNFSLDYDYIMQDDNSMKKKLKKLLKDQ